MKPTKSTAQYVPSKSVTGRAGSLKSGKSVTAKQLGSVSKLSPGGRSGKLKS